jgi:hypothetical protein
VDFVVLPTRDSKRPSRAVSRSEPVRNPRRLADFLDLLVAIALENRPGPR